MRKQVTTLIEEAKSNVILNIIQNNTIKSLKDASKNSREYFEERVESLELRLRTAELSKDEEKNLNN